MSVTARSLCPAQEAVSKNVLERCNTGNVTEWNAIKTQIRDALGRYFFEKTKRRPMILPIIQEVR